MITIKIKELEKREYHNNLRHLTNKALIELHLQNVKIEDYLKAKETYAELKARSIEFMVTDIKPSNIH